MTPPLAIKVALLRSAPIRLDDWQNQQIASRLFLQLLEYRRRCRFCWLGATLNAVFVTARPADSFSMRVVQCTFDHALSGQGVRVSTAYTSSRLTVFRTPSVAFCYFRIRRRHCVHITGVSAAPVFDPAVSTLSASIAGSLNITDIARSPRRSSQTVEPVDVTAAARSVTTFANGLTLIFHAAVKFLRHSFLTDLLRSFFAREKLGR